MINAISHILTIVTFTPALGALLLLFQNRTNIRAIRAVAVTVIACCRLCFRCT